MNRGVRTIVGALAVVAAAAFDGASAPAADLASGLVARYPLDSGGEDSSGAGLHAAVSGARPRTDGRIGGALSFDGRAFLALPAEVVRGRTELTVSLWARTESLEGAPRVEFWKNPTAFGFATTTPGSRDLGIVLEAGKAAYHHGLRKGRDTCLFTDSLVADGRWHHLAVSLDGRRVLLFVDGRLARGEAVFSTGTPRSAGPTVQTPAGEPLGEVAPYLGASNDASEPGAAEHFFRGDLDDVRIWSRALAAAEVAALWTEATGEAVEVVEPPEPAAPRPAGPAIETLVLEGGRVHWRLERRAPGWSLGAILLDGKALEAPVTSGVLSLRSPVAEDVSWLSAARCERVDARTARLSGEAPVEGATFSFEVEASVSAELPAAALDARWSVDRDVDAEVRLAWHEGFSASWRAHLYPFAEDARAVERVPLSYVGVPAALLLRDDASAAVLFGIDSRSDYLNPSTWTGTVGFAFEDGVSPPEFRAGAGRISAGTPYRLPLQVIASAAGDPLRQVAEIVRAWIRIVDFRVEPIHVRSPEEALAIYLDGRRATSAWVEGKGYVLQPGSWNAIYLGTTPESAWFEYRVHEITGDDLWRRRAFEQLDFTLKAQDTDPGSPSFGAFHTCYDLAAGTFNSDDRGVNKGWKPDLVAHMARYMLLAWQRVRDREGIDRRDWHDAALRAADWVVRQRNEDGGLPQKVDIATGAKSGSVVSGRALPAMPVIAGITGLDRHREGARSLERFLRERVERRLWFTGQHPDLPPFDLESDSIWGAIEYWLGEHDRTGDREPLDRAVADACLSLLWWCPKQLSWVESPTQCAHAEQQNYLQYSLYCYHNRKIECLGRLARLTGDPLFAALHDRVLQCVLWTQKTEGDLMGAMYERVADPWRARGDDVNSLGTLYLNELSLDAMVQLVDAGVRPSRGTNVDGKSKGR